MGRGEDADRLIGVAPGLRDRGDREDAIARLRESYEWIPDPESSRGDTLTVHHPRAPIGVDPIAGLYPDIRELPLALQMENMIHLHGGNVSLSYGLSLALLKSHDSPQELQLRQTAERALALMIAEGMTEEEAINRLWEITQDAERRLCWAADELGLPRDWIVETVREAARRKEVDEDMEILKIDLDKELELTDRFGVAPSSELDVLVDLPEGVRELSEQEQLLALRSVYASLIYDLVALSDYDAGVESPASWQVSARISDGSGDRGSNLEAMRADLASRQAQAVWAIRELKLPASGVLNLLERSARERLAEI